MRRAQLVRSESIRAGFFSFMTTEVVEVTADVDEHSSVIGRIGANEFVEAVARSGNRVQLAHTPSQRQFAGGWLSTETQLGDRTLLNPLTEGPAI